jgi:hypothetical protein
MPQKPSFAQFLQARLPKPVASHPSYPVGTPIIDMRDANLDELLRYGTTDVKGDGFFGGLLRPDKTGYMSEYSIPFEDKPGHFVDVPSIVPTLNRNEIMAILTNNHTPLPESVIQKALDFARQRQAAQLPYFARPGETDTTKFADLPRVMSVWPNQSDVDKRVAAEKFTWKK